MRKLTYFALPVLLFGLTGCQDQPTAPESDFSTLFAKAEKKPSKPPPDPDPPAEAQPVIAYERGGPGARALWVMDEDGANRTEVFVPGNFFVPSWSSLGEGTEEVPFEILITGNATHLLPVMKVEVFLDGGVPTAGMVDTLSTDPMYIQARVSPNGQEFVGVHVGPPEGFQTSIVVSGLGAFSPVTVYEKQGHVSYWPTWGSEGNIVFFDQNEETGQVTVQSLDRDSGLVSEVYQVPDGMGLPRRLSWSPDGSGFVFDADGDLVRVTLGGDPEVLGSGISPTWSPDGSKVVYSNRDRLYRKTIEDGGRDKRLTNGRMPDWKR